jgi:hypothetical protein
VSRVIRIHYEWHRRLDEECPHQVMLPRQQLSGDHEVMASSPKRPAVDMDVC